MFLKLKDSLKKNLVGCNKKFFMSYFILEPCYIWATCVVGYMCGRLHEWSATYGLHVCLATCVVGYMCGRLHVVSYMWLATCVVGYVVGYMWLATCGLHVGYTWATCGQLHEWL